MVYFLTLTCASGLFSPEDLFLVNKSRQVDVRTLTDPKTSPQIYLRIFKKIQLNPTYRLGDMKPFTLMTRQKIEQKREILRLAFATGRNRRQIEP